MLRYLFPVFLLLMVGCSSKKVQTDYDPAFQTSTLKTFYVASNSKAATDTLDDERIREAIKRELTQKGYEAAAEEKADFHITFRTAIQEDVPSNVSFGFGVGTYSSGVGTSVGTSRNVTSDKESLFIDMIDPKTKKTFWRAEVSKNRRDYKSPQERTDYMDKTVASMLETFPTRSNATIKE